MLFLQHNQHNDDSDKKTNARKDEASGPGKRARRYKKSRSETIGGNLFN